MNNSNFVPRHIGPNQEEVNWTHAFDQPCQYFHKVADDCPVTQAALPPEKARKVDVGRSGHHNPFHPDRVLNVPRIHPSPLVQLHIIALFHVLSVALCPIAYWSRLTYKMSACGSLPFSCFISPPLCCRHLNRRRPGDKPTA